MIQIGRGAHDGRRAHRRRGVPAEPGATEGAQRRSATAARCSPAPPLRRAALLLLPYFELANIVMVFLLAVVLVGVRYGRGPAVLAAFLNVVAFDFFFVPPRLSFAVTDVQYLVTFAVMLVVGLVIGQLTAGLRYQARVAGHREERARTLYEISRDLSGAAHARADRRDRGDASWRASSAARAALLCPTPGRLASPPAPDARQSDRSPPRNGPSTTPSPPGRHRHAAGHDFLFVPLKAPMRTRGVLAIQPGAARDLIVPEQAPVRDLRRADRDRAGAHALRRGGARRAVKMESERLRNSLLAAISHDLRTPLAALLGLAEAAGAHAARRCRPSRRHRAHHRRGDQAPHRAGEQPAGHGAAPDRRGAAEPQWQPLEEVVGSALRAVRGVSTAAASRSTCRRTCRWSSSTRC